MFFSYFHIFSPELLSYNQSFVIRKKLSPKCITRLKHVENFNGRILKANLSCTRKKSNSSDAKIFLSFFVSFVFELKDEHEVRKFEFCQVKVKVEEGINLQLTDKILPKLDANSSLLRIRL